MNNIRKFFIKVINTDGFKVISIFNGFIMFGLTTNVKELKSRLCVFIALHRLHVEFAIGVANYRALDKNYGLS